MTGPLRIGMLYKPGEPSYSIPEQVLGAQLAAEYTRSLWPASAPLMELVDRPVTSDPWSVDAAARELVREGGCAALLGMLTVPLSIRTAEWAEAEGVLYVAANNNPLVWDGRRHVFHIGVPSEMTGAASARYLCEERGARRVSILHADREFQVHAAGCTATALAERTVAVQTEQLGESPADDRALLERVRAFQPDAIVLLGSELLRQVELVRRAHELGGLPPMLMARGMLCREFAGMSGPAGEGYEFTDLYFRDERASSEEKALTERLAAVSPELVATASHGFGWDDLRLAAEAVRRGGSSPDEQVAYLESLKGHPWATGSLSFDPQNHNGRATHDPTTIARLTGGQYTIVSTSGR